MVVEVTALAAMVISCVSCCTSIGTCAHYRQTLVTKSNDKTDVDILNKKTIVRQLDGSERQTMEQKIHITDIDTDFSRSDTKSTQTGMPNKTAETLSSGAMGVLNKIVPLSLFGKVASFVTGNKETPSEVVPNKSNESHKLLINSEHPVSANKTIENRIEDVSNLQESRLFSEHSDPHKPEIQEMLEGHVSHHTKTTTTLDETDLIGSV